MDHQSEAIPEGWTNDPHHLELYFDHNSLEAYRSRCFGIVDAKIVLLGGRYYWGDFMLEDHLSEITWPTTFAGILNALATKGFSGMRLKALKMLKIDEKPPNKVPPEHEANRVLFVPAEDVPESSRTT
ncbi:uncharacterized protein BO72DRAFT_490083 [Aspergillus fijiensis CBS 313.89]|uniref:Uncharacterized protein n=1 Tax=Aspergillus fijiensis CBS 313.89 TaxID=1448319 RepID=A0A8G1VUD2_9EURO|nr:uncharacterized protein BO72DRAFT_490083 [Aspergillus fijiensis CBS 313.89]RAK72003.1 hypothetical protein BO72DRAFT_490083 [Aspergillus fijiensis CBS 313.89]